MICYKGRTFCNQPCGNRKCPDNFNKDDYEKAKKWWGNDKPPISFDNFRTDECGYIEVKK